MVEKMNIQCDVVFSNQSDYVGYEERRYGDFNARMISTQTRGVGKNRNISLMYADGDVLLFADDDIKYVDGYAEMVISEFQRFTGADVIIFNVTSNDTQRKQVKNKVSKRIHRFNRMPYGAPRIAVRRSSWEKSNIWFTPMFGGGTKYTSGEDSIFLQDAKKHGLKIYVSDKTIGEVDMSQSSWFSGRNEQYFFNKGAYCKAVHPHTLWLWKYYYCIKIKSPIGWETKVNSFNKGVRAYVEGKSFGEFES